MSLIERTLALAHPAPHRVIPPPVNSSKHNPVPDTPRSPDGYPLRRRLLLLHLASGALIALVLCAVFLAARKSDARQAAAHRLSALADFACAQWNQVDVPTSLPPPAITPAILDSVLAGFSTLPDVQEAALVDADGTVLAGYRRYPFPVATSPRPSQPGVFFDEDSLLFVRSCSVGARSHVLLHLRATVAPPPSPALAILALTGLAAGVSLLSFLALGRIALRPLHRLADDVRRAAGDPADAARVYSSTDHATAPLVDGFNELLWRIRRNGADLQAARLRAEREQSGLRFILEALPVGVTSSILDADGGLTQYVNGAQTRITGLSREQCGRPAAHARLTHPDDAARETVLRERLLSGEIDRFSLEKRLVRPDGSTIWVISTFLRRDYADGTLEELATFVDISELRRAREQAEREQARLRFILESMPIGITSAILDVEDRLTQYVNSAQERITGLSREQYNQPAAYARLTHPDDAAREEGLQERLRSGEIDRFSLEKRLLRPDGVTVWVISTYLRRDYADGTLEELATFVDVSELRRAREQAEREQARFRFIFETIPVGLDWMTLDDPAGRIVNPAHTRITGVPASLASEPARELEATHAEDRKRELALEARLLSGEIDHYTLEKRYLGPDGAVTWAELNLRRHADPVTGAIQRIGTLVDLTEHKRAQAEIERMHRQLIDTSRQAGMAEVATGVLHNVGNVLNSVNVSFTIVSDQLRLSKAPNLAKVCALLEPHESDLPAFFAHDPKGRMILPYLQALSASLSEERKTVGAEVDSLRRNIEHIKDIVAMQQAYAKTSGVSETISMPDLVEDALRMNADSFSSHDIEIVRDFQIRPVVSLDKNKALQILVNLLRNAQNACDESGRTEKRIVIRILGDENFVRIRITDNGVGIPPENLTRIFAHGFTTRKHGHGFGLHSGALAAREIGGSLQAFSDGPGQGATFELTLPHTPPSDS